MGRDKALLTLPDGSARTFVERLIALLSEHCAELLLVVRDQSSGKEYVRGGVQSQDYRLVYDEIPQQGPLMGLYSGLKACSYSHALVLAVDQPFVRPELLSWLAAFPLDPQVLVPSVQGIPQVLLARYPRAILPTIEETLRTGRRDPRALLERAPVQLLTEDVLSTVDPDLRSFLNINTPADWQAACRALE